MTHVASHQEKNAFSTPFQGVLPPSGLRILAESGRVHPLSGTPGNVVRPFRHPPRPTLQAPNAPRSKPPAPRRRGQRVQAGHGPFPAGYCLTPTAEFPMNSRVLTCICVHNRLPPPVQGPSRSRAPARQLISDN